MFVYIVNQRYVEQETKVIAVFCTHQLAEQYVNKEKERHQLISESYCYYVDYSILKFKLIGEEKYTYATDEENLLEYQGLVTETYNHFVQKFILKEPHGNDSIQG